MAPRLHRGESVLAFYDENVFVQAFQNRRPLLPFHGGLSEVVIVKYITNLRFLVCGEGRYVLPVDDAQAPLKPILRFWLWLCDHHPESNAFQNLEGDGYSIFGANHRKIIS